MECKLCNSTNLELFLDLGLIPLVDRFLSKEELKEEEKFYPLNVHLCKDCGLAQLGYVVPAEELYNENYAYESGTTKKRRENYQEFAEYVCKKFNLVPGSFIVDIGSNVGILLDSFKSLGMKVLGIDASPNVVKIANSKGIETFEGFFDEKIVKKIISSKQKAKVITATNLFAHIQNYFYFTKSLKNLLSDDGIFIFQVPHFLQLIKNLEYDTIYHEHISYFSLKPLIQFFERFDMELFDVMETDIDGGSIRCFVRKTKENKISSNLKNLLRIEDEERIYSIDRLKEFSNNVKKQKEELTKLLVSLKNDNKKIVGLSAPAKGMTLLNYCKIDNLFLNYITEKSSLKIGKFTPGTHILVEPDQKLLDDKPDYALILAWNFAEEIMKNLEDYHKEGRKFIIPIPHPKII